MPAIHSLTSNQYWRGINRRFDRRAAQLCQLGYRYVVTGGDMGDDGIRDEYRGEFVRDRYAKRRRISAGTVIFADGRAWSAVLAAAR